MECINLVFQSVGQIETLFRLLQRTVKIQIRIVQVTLLHMFYALRYDQIMLNSQMG